MGGLRSNENLIAEQAAVTLAVPAAGEKQHVRESAAIAGASVESGASQETP